MGNKKSTDIFISDNENNDDEIEYYSENSISSEDYSNESIDVIYNIHAFDCYKITPADLTLENILLINDYHDELYESYKLETNMINRHSTEYFFEDLLLFVNESLILFELFTNCKYILKCKPMMCYLLYVSIHEIINILGSNINDMDKYSDILNDINECKIIFKEYLKDVKFECKYNNKSDIFIKLQDKKTIHNITAKIFEDVYFVDYYDNEISFDELPNDHLIFSNDLTINIIYDRLILNLLKYSLLQKMTFFVNYMIFERE